MQYSYYGRMEPRSTFKNFGKQIIKFLKQGITMPLVKGKAGKTKAGKSKPKTKKK